MMKQFLSFAAAIIFALFPSIAENAPREKHSSSAPRSPSSVKPFNPVHDIPDFSDRTNWREAKRSPTIWKESIPINGTMTEVPLGTMRIYYHFTDLFIGLSFHPFNYKASPMLIWRQREKKAPMIWSAVYHNKTWHRARITTFTFSISNLGPTCSPSSLQALTLSIDTEEGEEVVHSFLFAAESATNPSASCEKTPD